MSERTVNDNVNTSYFRRIANAFKRRWKRIFRRRRLFRLTREGKYFLWVAVGVGFAAVNTGNNLLYLVLGLMLSLLLVSGTLSDLALWEIRVRRNLPPQIFAGEKCWIRATVKNRKKRIPSHLLSLSDTHFDGARHLVLVVPAQGESSLSYAVVPQERGVFQVAPIDVTTKFPFGLIEKGRFGPAIRDDGMTEIVVYPKSDLDIDSILNADGRKQGQEALRGRGGDEVDGLRIFRDGDTIRDVHWKKSAQRDDLIVRTRSGEEARVFEYYLPVRDAAYYSGSKEAFEHAIEEASSLLRYCVSDASHFVLRTDDAASISEDKLIYRVGGDPTLIWRFLASVSAEWSDV